MRRAGDRGRYPMARRAVTGHSGFKKGGSWTRGGSRPVSRVLSWTVIPLGRPSPDASSNLPGDNAGRAMVPLFGLAPGGVCPATDVATGAVRSYRTISPLPVTAGGIFSVALSVGSRLPGVTWHLALRSPDFPLSFDSDCLADSRHQYTRFRGAPDYKVAFLWASRAVNAW